MPYTRDREYMAKKSRNAEKLFKQNKKGGCPLCMFIFSASAVGMNNAMIENRLMLLQNFPQVPPG